jgi:hypothetical protein
MFPTESLALSDATLPIITIVWGLVKVIFNICMIFILGYAFFSFIVLLVEFKEKKEIRKAKEKKQLRIEMLKQLKREHKK